MTVLNVFTNKSGDFGTPLGIIEDLEKQTNEDDRLRIALDSGFTEVVFLESIVKPEISIYTPTQKLPFASHALVGIQYYLVNKYKMLGDTIKSMDTKIHVFKESNVYWAEADTSILPQFNLAEFPDFLTINNFSNLDKKQFKHTLVWCWQDKDKGLVRARTFASDWNIDEDEANGSGSMLLGSKLKKEITVFHGEGSIIHVIPIGNNNISVGGMVKQWV